MTFVSEHTIDTSSEHLDASEENYHATVEDFSTKQPFVLSYLLSDSFGILTEDEQAYLLYIALVIWKSTQATQAIEEQIDEDEIGLQEEKNWELLNASSSKKFREKLDVFFKKTPQEDLLAFLEDSLADEENEEEEFLTSAGRELIFVGAKTLIDVLTK